MSDRAWVATKACGCVAVVCSEDFLNPKELKDWGKRGYTAKLMPNEDVRRLEVRCAAHPRVKQMGLLEESDDAE